MSVYNGARYLREAMESILNQTLTDFEFIIINDGSTDETWAILSEYDDPRIHLIQNEQNIGLTRSLNKGLALARGKYIARMDADDVSLPERLEKQVMFLNQFPAIGILGCACWTIDADGKRIGQRQMPGTPLRVQWTLLLGNPFLHPGVMFRHRLLTDYGLEYDENLRVSQDYEFWVRLLKHTQGNNLLEALLLYRSFAGVTMTRRDEQLQNHDAISWHLIREEFPDFSVTRTQVSQLRALFVGGHAFVEGKPMSRSELAHLYLDLLKRFSVRYNQDVELLALRQDQAARVAQLIIESPENAGWARVSWRLICISPGLYQFFCRFLLKVFMCHVAQSTSLIFCMMRKVWHATRKILERAD